MKKTLIVISFVFVFAFAPILLMAVVQNWSATNLQAVSSFYVGSKNVFSFLDGLVDNQTVTNSIGDSTITQPKLSQALVDFIGSGGSVTNNPDDQTLETTPGMTIALKENYNVAADTNGLKTFNKHDLNNGDQVFIPGLDATSNPTYGGGFFIYADESSYPIDNIEVFDAATAGKVWVREERLRLEPVNVLHAGAIPDGDTDNEAAFENAINLAIDLERNVRIPAAPDSYYVANTVNIISDRVRKSLTIFGDGRRRTILSTDGDTLILVKRYGDPGNTGSTGTWHINLEDFTVTGAGSTTSLGGGIYCDTLLNSTIRRVDALKFKYGIYIDQSNSTVIDQCGASFCQYGVYLFNNVNGTVLNGVTTTNNDSSGIWLATGGGSVRTVIVGGEHGSQRRNITAGTGANFVAIDVNHELNSVACIDMFSSFGTLISGRYLLNGGGAMVRLRGTAPHLALYGTLSISNFNADSIYHHIADLSSGAEIKNYTASRFGLIRVYSALFGRHIYPSFMTIRPDNGLGTPDSTSRGWLYSVHARDATTLSDYLATDVRLGDKTTIARAILTDSWDWVLRNNTGSHARKDRSRFITGFKNFVTDAADHTDVQIPLSDALPDGYDNFYSAIITPQETNGRDVTVVLTGYVATEDTANVRIWHKSDTGGGFTVWLHYLNIIQRPYSSY